MILWIATALIGIGALAWGFRFAGQTATRNAPKFRDMPFGVAYGYVLGAALLLWLAWAYIQGRSADPAIANKFFFLRIAIEGFIAFGIAAWLFRILGRNVGTSWSRKMFRSMPLTASFGILTILIYAILAIFAGLLAPYGQEEIIKDVAANIVPGGDPALGGNPDFYFGTDQIGRDILSRLIYGAQNTRHLAVGWIKFCRVRWMF
jgi:peptide/nickel transport system permease protein